MPLSMPGQSPMAASIIVPLLSQRDSWLQQCLLSAVQQTLPTAVLVVTSPRTPASNLQVIQRLAAEYSQLRWFERQAGHGFAEAINAGWRRAQTPRVGLLLSDDWLSPDTIEQCLKHDADIVCTGHIGYSADGQQVLWRRQLRQRAFEQLPNLESKANYLTHFFLYRRDCVLAAGGVDADIGHVGPDDYDLPWTLLERNASVSLVSEPLYHYRDHDDTRLTLRPQQQQLADLRKLLSKHGVDATEQQRLVAEKARWYGVPCHVAMNNPHWYQSTTGITPEQLENDLGEHLAILVNQTGVPLTRIECISKDHVTSVGRSSFRLYFADGSTRKGRIVATAEQARRQFELSSAVSALPIARVLAWHGNALLEQWIDGETLRQYQQQKRQQAGAPDQDWITQAGALMGRLAVTADDTPELDTQHRPAASKLSVLDTRLERLCSAGLLEPQLATRIAQLAHDNAPELIATGLVHLDICPDNLVINTDGLHLIDNESLEVGALAMDLARTWYLWDLNRQQQATFLRGYARHRDPSDFIRYELFWCLVTLTAGAEYRHQTGQDSTAAIDALRRVAAGDLPRSWLAVPPKRITAGGPVRVGILCDYLAVGGQERALLNMLSRFDRSRFNPHVYSFRGGQMAPLIERMGVPLLIGSATHPLSWQRGWSQQDDDERIAYLQQLTDALRDDRIDAVINFAWKDGVTAARDAGVAITIERLDGPKLLAKIADKSSFDSVVAQSATTRDQLLSQLDTLNIDAGKVELIYSGIDLQRFDRQLYQRNAERQRLGFSDDELVIGYVGRLDPSKNLKTLIIAFARIDQQAEGVKVKLLIMGPDGGSLQTLHRACATLGIEDRVCFVEPTEDVAPTLAALDIFATPTLHGEGIPNAVLEAMAMGLPVVASDVGSIHELMERNGFLVPDPDPVTFARPLKQLVRSAKLRRRCSTNSRRLAQRFSLDYTVNSYQSLIIEHLNRRHAQSSDPPQPG